MEFFNSAIDVLQTLVVALGGGLCMWGGINLLEGYGQDKPLATFKHISSKEALIKAGKSQANRQR